MELTLLCKDCGRLQVRTLDTSDLLIAAIETRCITCASYELYVVKNGPGATYGDLFKKGVC